MVDKHGNSLNNWENNWMDATQECCKLLWQAYWSLHVTNEDHSQLFELRERNRGKRLQFAGYCERRDESFFQSSYYGNLVMNSNRDDGKNSIM